MHSAEEKVEVASEQAAHDAVEDPSLTSTPMKKKTKRKKGGEHPEDDVVPV